MIIVSEERVRCVCGQFACPNEQEHQQEVQEFQKRKLTKEEIVDFWQGELIIEARKWYSLHCSFLCVWWEKKTHYNRVKVFHRFNQINILLPEKNLRVEKRRTKIFIDHERTINTGLIIQYIKKQNDYNRLIEGD